MLEFIIVLLEFDLPCCGIEANFVGFTPISKIAVIGLDDYWYKCSSKEM